MLRRMLITVLAALLQLVLLQGAAVAQASSTYHSSGAFAETFFTANGSLVDLFVARGCVGTSCTGEKPGTYIVWNATTNNPDGSTTFTEGDGTIPDSAFDSSTLQHMSLNVDTSQAPGFNTTTCTFVPGQGFTDCHSGPFGVMQATWQKTEQDTSAIKQDTVTTLGPFTTKAHVDENEVSAGASGSFLGTAFASSIRAQMGTNNDHTMTITKGQ